MQGLNSSAQVQSDAHQIASAKTASPLFSWGMLAAMVCAFFLIDAVLPLRTLMFHAAYPGTKLQSWLLLPARLLFPGRTLISVEPLANTPPPLVPPIVAFHQVWLLFGAIGLLFACYILAVYLLPRRISYRFLFFSTLLLGLLCLFIPVLTSQDIFSYILYARIGVIHHLNPLTTLPFQVKTDPIYPTIYWIHQPSAYGPTWIAITSLLQALLLPLGAQRILSMEVALRLFGLAMHLGSLHLLWRMSGRVTSFGGTLSPERRMQGLLAFAWNPLLLFEACVNAHNDTTILFLILLAMWVLQLQWKTSLVRYLLTAALLALAVCLKVTLVVLLPPLLLFLWLQGLKRWALTTAAVFAVVVLLFYAPFWQHGAVLLVLHVNPGTTRDVNTPYEFALHLIASLRHRTLILPSVDVGTPREVLTHQISMVSYVVIYGALCLYTLRHPRLITSFSGLVGWMACAWLLYCVIGSPWFWPWYMTTFFGLFAILHACDMLPQQFTRVMRMPLAVLLFAFGMFMMYGFFTWGPHISYVPGLYQFQWGFFRGFVPWILPLLALRVRPMLALFSNRAGRQEHVQGMHETITVNTSTGSSGGA